MGEWVVRLYDAMAGHRRLCLVSFVAATLVLLALVLRLDFKEDISDFLPLETAEQEQLRMYQEVSGASRLFVIFESRDSVEADPDVMVQAIEKFVSIVGERDTARMVSSLTDQADLSQAQQVAQFVYRHIPFFLDATDYARIDSLLQRDDYVAEQLQADREMLMFPVGSLLSENIQFDPLNLFTPVVSTLQQGSGDAFELYEGYIFTADMRRAIVMLDSSFGSSETEGNSRLLALLQGCADEVLQTEGDGQLNVHITGGPAIAVGNASQIKTDSLLSVSLAVVLILLLLYYSFRKVRNLLLIVVAIGWGWLFALAGLSLVHREVSIIVIGISSVILGIAVNYPLHLIAHLSHTPDVRTALREIAKPLVVGNITTVGAFLALVPLQSVALRDLGLFSAMLLIGTILFVLLWLPHMVKAAPQEHGRMLSRLAAVSLHDKPWLVAVVIVLTLFFGWHSLRTSFDTDLSHINYMTAEQKADMALLQQMGEAQPAESNPHFLLADSIQQQRLLMWARFVNLYHTSLLEQLHAEAPKVGFADDSFREFEAIVDGNYQPQPLTYFRGLPPTLLMQNIDVKHLNSRMLSQLSDNFNYIGWACGCIVFFFLWFSFRRFSLAVLSFLPMAVSWLWILGIMALCGIQFNIVNVILATFIFGQGDDYTIFMTEGAVYEATHHKPMLASYKRAIILSALIMFIGIGSLIVARHPALHSLAEVTIVGMLSVVLMAFILPPLCYGLLLKIKSKKVNKI